MPAIADAPSDVPPDAATESVPPAADAAPATMPVDAVIESVTAATEDVPSDDPTAKASKSCNPTADAEAMPAIVPTDVVIVVGCEVP